MLNKLKRNFLSKTFVNYGLIGMTGVTLDFLIYLLLVKIGFHPIYASAISVSIAITNNFILNAVFNFKTKDQLLRRFVNFYGVGCIGILLTSIILFIGHDILAFSAVLVKLVSIPPVVALQFILNKKFSFSKNVHVLRKFARIAIDKALLWLVLSVAVYLSVISVIFSMYTEGFGDAIDAWQIVYSILTAIAISALLAAAISYLPVSRSRYSYARWVSMFIFITGLLSILVVHNYVNYDLSDSVYLRAAALDPTEPNIPMQTLPNQQIVVIIMMIFKKIFGPENFLPMMFLNLFSVILIANLIIKLTDRLFANRKITFVTAIVMATLPVFYLYLPMIFLDIPSIAVMVGGIYYLVKYVDLGGRKRLIFGSTLIIASVALKYSFIVVAFAICFCLLLTAIYSHKSNRRSQKKSLIIAALSIPLLSFFVQFAIGTLYENMYLKNYPVRYSALSSTGWVAMGLQSGEYNVDNPNESTSAKQIRPEHMLMPGSFNWYTTWTTGVEMDKRTINDSLRSLTSNPGYLFNFFLYKTAYLWANPLFADRVGKQGHLSYQIDRNERTLPVLLEKFISKESFLNRIYFLVYDAMQTVVYVFFAVFMVIEIRKRRYDVRKRLQLALPLTVILTGFLFYMIWEVQPRYAVIYYILAIPMASAGFVFFIERLQRSIAIQKSLQYVYPRPTTSRKNKRF